MLALKSVVGDVVAKFLTTATSVVVLSPSAAVQPLSIPSNLPSILTVTEAGAVQRTSTGLLVRRSVIRRVL